MTGRLPRLSSAATPVLISILLCSAPGAAQSPTATLGGRVTDEREDAVVGAAVVVTNAETGLRRETETDGEGGFAVALLPPGRYVATVAREGFKTAEVVDVELRAGERSALRIVLAAGAISESVTVEGASLIETESTAVGARIERELLENLPLSGRSLTSILTLVPGVVQTQATQFSVNGQRTNANYFTVDGVSANFTASGFLPALSAFGGTSSLVSVDAVQEVAVLTSSYASEYGRTPGAQVAIVTRSGTNDFHGSVSEYLRNDALDATDWFVNSNPEAEKPPLRSNQFGGVIGGPIVRNRTFFFVSYEGQRLLLGQLRTWMVPSISAREQAPEWMRPVLNAFPIPNGPAHRRVAEFSATYSNPWKLDATSVRVDHTLGERVTLFGRYHYAPSHRTNRGSFGVPLTQPSHVIRASGDTRTLTLGSNQMLGPRISNELRVNVSKSQARFDHSLDDFGGAVPLSNGELFFGEFTLSNTFRSVEIIASRDLPGGRYLVGTVMNTPLRQVNVVDHLSVIAGGHQFRLGADYRRLSLPSSSSYEVSTTFDLRTPPDPPAVGVTVGFNGTGRSPAQALENLSLYGQDTWKVTPRLTFTCGLRWEVNSPPESDAVDGMFVVVGADDPATMRLASADAARYDTAYGSVALRLGAAYALSDARGRETVLRGGWGMFYDLGAGNLESLLSLNSTRDLGNLPYPLDPSTIVLEPTGQLTPPFSGMLAVDGRLALPRTFEASLTLEQALGADQTVSVSYVGAFGRKLLSQEYLVKPNPTFDDILILRNGADSDYNALQVHFQRRVAAGLGALASYTWSHAIDTVSSDVNPVLARAQDLPPGTRFPGPMRSHADFDARHTFAAAVTYDVPAPGGNTVARAILGDWSTDWVLQARSALPVDLLQRRFNLPSVRPSYVPGELIYLNEPDAPGGWRINKRAFVIPATGQGNVARNALRGFPVWQLDLALRRRFALTERLELQFRAEVFNVLNHPNFAGPVPDLALPKFGKAPTMLATALVGLSQRYEPAPFPTSQSAYQIGGPRAFQFALKLQF